MWFVEFAQRVASAPWWALVSGFVSIIFAIVFFKGLPPPKEQPDKEVTQAASNSHTTGPQSPIFNAPIGQVTFNAPPSEELTRPRLGVTLCEILPDEVDGGFLISTTINNSGQHPLKRLRGIMILDSMDGSPLIPKTLDSTGVEIVQNVPYTMQAGGLSGVGPNTNPVNATLCLKYVDAVTGKPYEQIFYMRWAGLKKGKGITRLGFIQESEQAALLEKYRKTFDAISIN